MLQLITVLSCHGFHVVPHTKPHVAPHGSIRNCFMTPCMNGAFSLQSIMDSVSEFTASLTGTAKKPPSAAEIEEYCRDPDSSGCDLDMVGHIPTSACLMHGTHTLMHPAASFLCRLIRSWQRQQSLRRSQSPKSAGARRLMLPLPSATDGSPSVKATKAMPTGGCY